MQALGQGGFVRAFYEVIKEYALSYGIKAELVIYNFANIFYEIGYVYKNVFDNSPYQVKARFGISLGV